MIIAMIIEKQTNREADMTIWPLDSTNYKALFEQLIAQEEACINSGILETYSVLIDEQFNNEEL